jgi:hypothetical protein
MEEKYLTAYCEIYNVVDYLESNYHPLRRWLVFVGPGRYADLSV